MNCCGWRNLEKRWTWWRIIISILDLAAYCSMSLRNVGIYLQSTRCHNPEDQHWRLRCRQNLENYRTCWPLNHILRATLIRTVTASAHWYSRSLFLQYGTLFMSTGWDYISELRPITGLLLFIPQSTESHSGMILTGETRRTRRKTCPSAALSTTNPSWIDPGPNPGFSCECPATNDLSYGTAYMEPYCTDKSPYWEAYSDSAGQEIPCIV
jgi:hypothetical protein